jgi:hypothetical protein
MVCLQWAFAITIFGIVIFIIFSRLYTLHGSNSSWLFFCESHTTIDLLLMLELLNKYSPTEVTSVFNLCFNAVHLHEKYTGCGNGRWLEVAESHVL